MFRVSRYLMLVGVLLMMSTAAIAQADGPEYFQYNVRLTTLSGGDDFATNYWNDSGHVTMWFGELGNYTDMLTIGFDPEDEINAISLNKSEKTFGAYYIALQEGMYDYMGDYDEYNHFTLGYSYALENMKLGVLYNRQNMSETDGDDEVKDSYNSFGLGLDYDFSDEVNIDATFAYSSYSWTYKVAPADTTGDGNGLMFGARAFWAYQDDITLVPVFIFRTAEWQEGYKDTDFALGLGFDYTVNDNNHIILGAKFAQAKSEEPYLTDETWTETTTTMPGFSVAVEHEFFDWLELRAGASKNFSNYKVEYSTDTPDDTEDMCYAFNYSFGAGIQVGDWAIDLELNPEALYQMGYWLHGYEDGEEPIWAIQASLFF
ncbi:MAG: hypothetical protein JW819_02440 [Candidatus Krumholzibacteriota bacterium]|nr:hypothetical protein [Candidatus Krumholzibacteriota bacterium]